MYFMTLLVINSSKSELVPIVALVAVFIGFTSNHLEYVSTMIRFLHNPNEYETIVSVGIPSGAMRPLQVFCSSVAILKSFEHRFQCLYQFLPITHSFGPSSYTHLNAHHEVIIFFLPGSGRMTHCSHIRQPLCTIIS